MLRAWIRDDSGQALSEYGLLIAVIAVVAIATLVTFRQSIVNVFTNAASAINSAG
jgi:Flp pilus assembly pilin Flp